jgi:hypothetical protein
MSGRIRAITCRTSLLDSQFAALEPPGPAEALTIDIDQPLSAMIDTRRLKEPAMTETIALIGAGAMGGAIGARLVATGTRLWSLTSTRPRSPRWSLQGAKVPPVRPPTPQGRAGGHPVAERGAYRAGRRLRSRRRGRRRGRRAR